MSNLQKRLAQINLAQAKQDIAGGKTAKKAVDLTKQMAQLYLQSKGSGMCMVPEGYMLVPVSQMSGSAVVGGVKHTKKFYETHPNYKGSAVVGGAVVGGAQLYREFVRNNIKEIRKLMDSVPEYASLTPREKQREAMRLVAQKWRESKQ